MRKCSTIAVAIVAVAVIPRLGPEALKAKLALVELLRDVAQRKGATATCALNVGEWFRRFLLVMLLLHFRAAYAAISGARLSLIWLSEFPGPALSTGYCANFRQLSTVTFTVKRTAFAGE